ncbi:hypothetical protein ALC62_09853, partial [Cyphomyrmex costatus]
TNAVVDGLTFNWNTMSSICRQQIFQLRTLPEPFVGNNVHFEEKIAYLASATFYFTLFIVEDSFVSAHANINFQYYMHFIYVHKNVILKAKKAFFRHSTFQLTFTELNMRTALSVTRARRVTGQSVPFVRDRALVNEHYPFRVATRYSVARVRRVHCGDAEFNAPLPTILSKLALENF